MSEWLAMAFFLWPFLDEAKNNRKIVHRLLLLGLSCVPLTTLRITGRNMSCDISPLKTNLRFRFRSSFTFWNRVIQYIKQMGITNNHDTSLDFVAHSDLF